MSELPRSILMTADTIGGVWTYALELTRALAPHGVEVALATMGAPLSADQWAEVTDLPNLRIFESRHPLEWMPDPWAGVDEAGRWLLACAEEARAQVIHLNGYVHASLPWRAPVLVVAHSCVLSWWEAVKGEPAPPEWEEYRRRVRAGLRAADLVIAPTKAMLDSLPAHYGPIARGRVIPNARTPHLFRAGTKQPVIFSAGRLGDAAKNMAALGAAAEGLSWPVHVAGAARDPSGEQEVPAHLHLLGRLAPEELADHLSEAAIYCLPALYEPFGLSILEAALSGCALVLGSLPSLREVWGEAAVYVPPRSLPCARCCSA